MQVSAAYNSTTLSVASTTATATSASGKGMITRHPAGDRVAFSDKALNSSRQPEATGIVSGADAAKTLIGDMIAALSGRDVEFIEEVPEEAAGTLPVETEAPAPVLSFQSEGASFSAEHVSLSVSGTIATKDGKNLDFTLDLQYDHASLAASSSQLQAGPDGLTFSFAGTAAELTSTSFSFTLGASEESRMASGFGSLKINDEISHIGKALKPLVKEFAQAAGMGGWGSFNRFMRSVA